MRAEIRRIGGDDFGDVSSWQPDSAEWSQLVRVLVGPAGDPGEESIDILVCSVPWIASLVERDGLVDGRHHLIVDRFDWPMVKAYIERRVHQCTGKDWGEVSSKLSRLGFWEFEDYVEHNR